MPENPFQATKEMQPGEGKPVFMKQQLKGSVMRSVGKTMMVLALAAACIGPAMARQTYIDGAVSPSAADYPGAPRPVSDNSPAPYAMNYSDEAAQTIGVRDGHLDVFSTNSAESHLPYLSGGLGGDGAMLKLQWHPGE
jgi:hypothetical protein